MALETLNIRRLRAWLRILRLVRGTENHLREFLRIEFDTTLPRFDVAAALYRQDAPMKMSDISKLLLVSNGNATNVVDRLEREQKVVRIVDGADRRIVLVQLTPEGREWFRVIAEAHAREIDKIFAALNTEDLDHLRALVRKIEGASNAKNG